MHVNSFLAYHWNSYDYVLETLEYTDTDKMNHSKILISWLVKRSHIEPQSDSNHKYSG